MSLHNSRILSGRPSILLISLRLGVPLVVVFNHALDMWFSNLGVDSSLPGKTAHAAVVVFFVLSGYVTAHTTTSNNRGALHYAYARLSRLYSVVLSALVLTALIQWMLIHINPALGAEYTCGLSLLRYLITAGLLNEIWFVSAAPPINGLDWWPVIRALFKLKK